MGANVTISLTPSHLSLGVWIQAGLVSSVQEIDKKLTEADAYLQTLIEQLKFFYDKLQNRKDDEQSKKIKTLKERTKT